MRAVLYLLGTWPRRRRLALAGVALLAAASLGFVVLAGLGARRAATGWERLRERARGEDAQLDVASIDAARRVAEKAQGIPGVARAAPAAYSYLVPEGQTEDFSGGVILPLGPGALDEIWRPVLTAGRPADPARVDEVVVNELFVRTTGLGVGGRFTLSDPIGLISQPVTIMGIGVLPTDFTFAAGSAISYPTAAFTETWAAQLHELFDTGGVELVGPSVLIAHENGVDVLELTARLRDTLSADGVTGVNDAATTGALVVDVLGLQRNGYLAIAVVGGLATLSMLTLVLARVTRLQPTEATALSALGLSRSDLRLAVLVPGALVAMFAVAGGIIVAALGQGSVPTGLAEQVGAGRGLRSDIGFLALSAIGAGLALASVVGAMASRSTGDARARPLPGRLRLTALPWPSVGTGLRAAAGGLASSGRQQASAAFTAVAVAVVGIVAMAVVVRSRDELRADLSRVGKFYDLSAGYYTAPGELAPDREKLVASPSVTGVATIETFTVAVDGAGTAAIAVTAHKGGLSLSIVDGRLPVGEDELVASAPFLRRLHRSLGDTVEVSGPGATRRFRVVGTTVLPLVAPTGIPGEQVAFTSAGREAVGAEPEAYGLGIDVADPVAARHDSGGSGAIADCDVAGILPLLGVDKLEGSVDLCIPRGDERIVNIEEMGSLPGGVVGLFAALGAAGLAYLLSASFRRARRDLAVLRVLGFTRGQSIVTVLVQAGTVGLVGALVALPFGVALGRAAWKGVADGIGIVVVAEVSLLGTLGVMAGAVVVAELLALPFAAQAVTRPPAHSLRAE